MEDLSHNYSWNVQDVATQTRKNKMQMQPNL